MLSELQWGAERSLRQVSQLKSCSVQIVWNLPIRVHVFIVSLKC